MQNKSISKNDHLHNNADKIIKKTVSMVILLDTYGVLLTERQRQYLSLFYEEDFSLAEIGQEFSISRQAVHDTIKHGESQLQEYENALHLVQKDQARLIVTEKLRKLVGNTSAINELLEQIQ